MDLASHHFHRWMAQRLIEPARGAPLTGAAI
jgi:hypothetical protein